MKKYFLLLLAFGLVSISCKKNDDDVTPPETSEEPKEETPVVKSVADYPVQDFMWNAMNLWYFWQEDVADLADEKDDLAADYAEFLSTQADPEDFYYNICNNHRNIVGSEAATDRFSYHAEDYRDLVQSSQGVSKNNGVKFGLGAFTNSDGLFGFVRYIVPGSDADGKDIKRGDIFIGVNGNDLNRSNYIDLLYGDSDTYTLNFAAFDENGALGPSGRELSLTKTEGLVENPIFINKIIEQNGVKIGYLMYNRFLFNYDEELNDVFNSFREAGINELILDFRYNGGGRVSSAQQIASTIYDTDKTKILIKNVVNTKIDQLTGLGEDTFFVDETINGTPINPLNLNRVHVIAIGSSASASELIINGLAPYMEVVHIGEPTAGKSEFSLTLVDEEVGSYVYNPDRVSLIKSQWAIQPLVGRSQNSEDFVVPFDGLVPNKVIAEDLSDMGILGDLNERLLNFTLNEISGASAKRSFEPIFPIELVLNDELEISPMSMDGLIKPKFNDSEIQK